MYGFNLLSLGSFGSYTRVRGFMHGNRKVYQYLSIYLVDDFRVFCGDLGNEVTDEKLQEAFKKYPSLQKCRVVRDHKTHKTKGYGFISFKDPVDYTRAMREMNGKGTHACPVLPHTTHFRC